MEEHLDKIRRLESSGGRNDNCQNKGLINGYGYGQSTFVWNCFKSHNIVRGKVQGWFEKRIPEMGLETATCYYNSGHKVKDCPYWQKYKSL